MQSQVINAINNSPLNRGLDGCAWLSTPGNIAITFENGDIALFEPTYGSRDIRSIENTYAVHILFESRGRQALDHLKEAFRQMIEDHGATILYGHVPDFRRDTKIMVRWAGCRSLGKVNTSEGLCETFIFAKVN